MKLVPVCCQNCGASLQISDSVRFVTCQFCQTQLIVQHTGPVIFTELPGELAEKTSRLSAGGGNLRLQNQLQQLEREWMAERETLLIRPRNGPSSEPSIVTVWSRGLLFLGIALAGLVVVLSIGPAAHTVIAILVLMMFGLGGIARGLGKVQRFQQARDAYLRKRHALEAQVQTGMADCRDFPRG